MISVIKTARRPAYYIELPEEDQKRLAWLQVRMQCTANEVITAALTIAVLATNDGRARESPETASGRRREPIRRVSRKVTSIGDSITQLTGIKPD